MISRVPLLSLVLASAWVASPVFAAVEGKAVAQDSFEEKAPAYDASRDPQRYQDCLKAIEEDAAKVADYALQWQGLGGGLPARHCLALAQMELGQYDQATLSLMRAAQLAESSQNPMAAELWGQAGNAALLDGKAQVAVGYFASALVAAGEFAPQRSANLYLDRARAHVALADLAAAKADLEKARQLAPKEPVAWLLSATLARRQGDLAAAQTLIDKALALAAQDPDVRLEAGNIAGLGGDLTSARQHWEAAIQAAPESASAILAKQALQDNPAD